jgi:steroid 5-alpha reductase family enzyme
MLAMAGVMVLAWVWQWRGGSPGIVDVAWTFGVGLTGITFALCVADGLLTRRILVASCIGIWSLRLGGHLLMRVVNQVEDERYSKLKAEWGAAAQLRMFFFYQSQAIAAPLFALPMLVAGRSTAALNAWEWAGLSIWCIAIVGEWQADRQLARFRAEPENRQRVCKIGWWRYSRHPNYFFEWLHWCSYVPFAAFAPAGWLAVFAPLAMYYFLNFVTGIPPAEAQAVTKRGDEYREYQRRTSPFFPLPPVEDRRQ